MSNHIRVTKCVKTNLINHFLFLNFPQYNKIHLCWKSMYKTIGYKCRSSINMHMPTPLSLYYYLLCGYPFFSTVTSFAQRAPCWGCCNSLEIADINSAWCHQCRLTVPFSSSLQLTPSHILFYYAESRLGHIPHNSWLHIVFGYGKVSLLLVHIVISLFFPHIKSDFCQVCMSSSS